MRYEGGVGGEKEQSEEWQEKEVPEQSRRGVGGQESGDGGVSEESSLVRGEEEECGGAE